MGWFHDHVLQELHDFEHKAEKLEHEIEHNKNLKTFADVVDKVYSGINSPDFNAPPELEGNSEDAVTTMTVVIILVILVLVALGVVLDRQNFKFMDGRPKFWAIAMLVCSYVLLIPGLTQPLFSFNIVINIIGQRKYVEPDPSAKSCTESTPGLVRLLLDTGCHMGAVVVILFAMVIPALELIMLVVGEIFRFSCAKCGPVFRWIILWVQHRSKWASPDTFAYILLVHLVRTLDREPLILTRARLDIGFACFTVFCVTATVSALGVPLPPQDRSGGPTSPPLYFRCCGAMGTLITSIILLVVFSVLFYIGCTTPCMSLVIEEKQLFPPYGPLPLSAKPAVDALDLPDLLNSDTSVASCIRGMYKRLTSGEANWEANTILAITVYTAFVVVFTALDVLALVLAAFRLACGHEYMSLSDPEEPRAMDQRSIHELTFHHCPFAEAAHVMKKLAMLDVSIAGVSLVTVCMSMYQKYGIVVSTQKGLYILLAAEVIHNILFHIVTTAVEYVEGLEEEALDLRKESQLQWHYAEEDEAYLSRIDEERKDRAQGWCCAAAKFSLSRSSADYAKASTVPSCTMSMPFAMESEHPVQPSYLSSFF